MIYLHFSFRWVTGSIVALCLGGCSTPNLQPFADQTAGLATAISGEQKQMSFKLMQVAELWKEACDAAGRAVSAGQVVLGDPCAQAQIHKQHSSAFEESRRVIDGLMGNGVAYAGSLAELAKAGEMGPAAADSLLGTVKGFGTVFSIGTTFVTDTVVTALQKIALVATRVQAQKTLAEATWAAKDTIAAVADAVDIIFGRVAGDIEAAVYAEEVQARTVLAGRNMVGLFQDVRISREVSNERLLKLRNALVDQRCAVGAQKLPDECKLLETELRTAAELGRLLDRMRPDYERYVADRASAALWFKDRTEKRAAIRKAVGAWKSEHDRVAAELKRCGGLNAHRCADINATSLKTALEQVDEIRLRKAQ